MFPKTIYLVLFLLIIIIAIAINNYNYFLKNKCFFKIIPKNTILYHSSFTDINNYSNEKRTWFSEDKYYIYKMKTCLQNVKKKCDYNKFVSISPTELMGSINKWCEPCKTIYLYKLTLKRDIMLLHLPSEIDINYYDINHILMGNFPDIMGVYTNYNLLGENKNVYYFYYHSKLFSNPIIEKLNYNQIMSNSQSKGSCGIFNWSYYIAKHSLYFIYLETIKKRLKYCETYHWASTNNNITSKLINIRISSYNVHSWKDVFYNENSDNIINNIINTNPDIICLQEFTIIKNSSIKKLYSLYQYRYYYGNLAILTKYPIINSYYKTLGRDNVYFLQRYLLVSKIKIGNRIFNILNTHLDAFDNSELSRLKQLNVIINEIKKINQNENMILAGDFNSLKLKDYTQDYFNYLLQQPKYIPPLKNIKVIDTIEQYLYDTKYLDREQQHIKNDFSVWSLRRVDYIFINKQIPVKFNINKNASSDHNLIYCDI